MPLVSSFIEKQEDVYKRQSIHSRNKIIVTDHKDITHFLSPAEILYVNAVGRNCMIYTTDGSEIYNLSLIHI